MAARRGTGGWGPSGGCASSAVGPREDAVAAGSSDADNRAERPMRDVSRAIVTRLARIDCTHDTHTCKNERKKEGKKTTLAMITGV